MAYYRTCPTCGCNLDPGERCDDCREKTNEAASHATGYDLGNAHERIISNFSARSNAEQKGAIK